jgi:ethanolamine utilization protein EutP (predicted NTPase)
MESFNSFNNNNQDEFIIENINLRTVSAITLVSKSNTLSKNIQSVKSQDSNLDKKLNLLSKQILYSSLLTAQLALMSKKRK